jgi:hypothetical protein
MVMLDLDRLAGDTCRLRRMGDGAKCLLGLFLHARFVLNQRVFDHPGIGREYMKRRQDHQADDLGVDPFSQGDAVLDRFSGEF